MNLPERRRVNGSEPILERSQVDIARDQFLSELAGRARQAELDQSCRERWEKRRPAIQAAEHKERRLLLRVLVAVSVVALLAAIAIVAWLVSQGLPVLLALVIALVACTLPAGGGCMTVITISHRH
jgi:Flp pilus assembly protein TadB